MFIDYTEDDDNSKLCFDKSESKDKVEFLNRIIDLLLVKDFPDIERRRLQVARIYLSYHPIVPEADYIISISFKSNDLFYEIAYSYEMISFLQYYTDEGSVYYNFKYTLYQTGQKEEEGDFLMIISDFESEVKDLPADNFWINNEYV